MTPEDQEIMLEAGRMAREWYTAERLAQEEALEAELADRGINVVYPDDAWKAEMYEDADIIWQEALDSGNYDEEFINQLYELYQENTAALK